MTYAQVCYFDEFASWAVTLYETEHGDRARDSSGRDIEAEWYAYKAEAVARATRMLEAREIKSLEIYSAAGRCMRTRQWVPCATRPGEEALVDMPPVSL